MTPSNDTDDEQTDETMCTFRATVTTEDGELEVTTHPPDGATTIVDRDTEQGDVTGFSPGE